MKKAFALAIRLGIVALLAVCVINSLAALQEAQEEKEKRERELAKARARSCN